MMNFINGVTGGIAACVVYAGLIDSGSGSVVALLASISAVVLVGIATYTKAA